MSYDAISSWTVFAPFVSFLPAATVAIVFVPLTVVVWLSYRGRRDATAEQYERSSDDPTAR
ncbi:hypothetical protein DVK03_17230 [Haloferax sp. Atlit-109R]|nr:MULTISPECIES: hypothetical protein [unclassified Haloferax]RDZ33769.1 hypothetical protein C5B88_18450 [Haloferax sp. Atlit-24N]RLM34291.1 hypothetical protein DVK03_17230 [Haloferax sp. Atlit-109R]RLM41110.1 hypothetical protein DVK04_17045 [Haloferax sp. Atlit-105R]